METAQKMVREAAAKAMPDTKVVDEDGLPKVVYHNTSEKRKKFDIKFVRKGMEIAAHFFAPERDPYGEYGPVENAVFLNITNPAGFNEAYEGFQERQQESTQAGMEQREHLLAQGYDGGILTEDGKPYEYFVFDSNQIKSADPVTYDDAGNVIPLSQRFNPARDDIRYSIGGLFTGSAADYDQPSLVWVGTGEGTQAYGWGLYSSNRRGVAKGYARRAVRVDENSYLGRDDYLYEYMSPGFIAAFFWGKAGSSDKAKVLIKEEMPSAQEKYDIYGDDVWYLTPKNLHDAYAFLEKHGNKFDNDAPIDASEHLYEQTFFTNRAPGDESHLLKWYEPVSEENVRRISEQAKKEGLDIRLDFDKLLSNYDKMTTVLSGAKMYQILVQSIYSPKAASEFLARAGIDGVKYPVDSYGGKGVKDGDEVGWNYVSFRDDNIRVDHKWVDGQIRFSIKTNIDDILSRFDDAKGKTKKEIFATFDNTAKIIGVLPDDLILPPGLDVAKRIVNGAQAYILDHIHNKPGHEHELTSDDARRILALIDPHNEMRVVPQRGSLSLAFIAKNPNNGWDCIVIAPKRGEFYLFKTMFAQTKKPYQDKALIRYSASVRRSDAANHLIRGSLSSIRDFSETKDIIPQTGAESQAESAKTPQQSFDKVNATPGVLGCCI